MVAEYQHRRRPLSSFSTADATASPSLPSIGFLHRTREKHHNGTMPNNNVRSSERQRQRSNSSETCKSPSYRRRTTRSSSHRNQHQEQGRHQQQPPIQRRITVIPMSFAQPWAPLPLFLESSRILLDFLLYQQGILPLPMETYERSVVEDHRCRLCTARKEILRVWQDLFMDHSTKTPQQQQFLVSLSFSEGGSSSSSSRGTDTCYILRLQMPSAHLHVRQNDEDANSPFVPSENNGLIPPRSRLARKLLSSVLSQSSSATGNPSHAVVHVWMEHATLETLWRKTSMDRTDSTTRYESSREGGPTASSSTPQHAPANALTSMRRDDRFAKKFVSARARRIQGGGMPQIILVDLQLPLPGGGDVDGSVVVVDETTDEVHLPGKGGADDTVGRWMKVGHPMKRIEK
jgi:hypothetical protein